MKLKLGNKSGGDGNDKTIDDLSSEKSQQILHNGTDNKSNAISVGNSKQSPLQTSLCNAKSNKTAETTRQTPKQSPLAATLAEKKTDIPKAEVSNEMQIPKTTTKKYRILEEIPEGITPEVAEDFLIKMQSVVDNMGNDQIHNIMFDILEYTQSHPEIKLILRPEDIQVFVRGARISYAGVLTSKNTNKEKRGAKAERITALADELGDMDLGI